jgi:hypothetical protein
MSESQMLAAQDRDRRSGDCEIGIDANRIPSVIPYSLCRAQLKADSTVIGDGRACSSMESRTTLTWDLDGYDFVGTAAALVITGDVFAVVLL